MEPVYSFWTERRIHFAGTVAVPFRVSVRDTMAIVVWSNSWWRPRSVLWTSSAKWNDEPFAGGEVEGSLCSTGVPYEGV